MTTIESTSQVIGRAEAAFTLEEDHLAAVAFLARYRGRTLEAYRHDLRAAVPMGRRSPPRCAGGHQTHLELFWTFMEERGLAASTIDRRLSTACGFYRFAHIDGRIASNPAQYVRRPTVHLSERHGLDRGELARVLLTAERFDHPHAALTVLLDVNGLRVSEACDTNIEDMGMERGHRVLHIVGKGSKPALIPLVPRTARTLDLAIGERREVRSCSARTATLWIDGPPIPECGPRASVPDSAWCTPICSERASSWPPALDAGVPLREVQVAARHADSRTTTVYDGRRQDLDWHAAYVVVAFVAEA
jgi:site-specific recombinase XerD